MTNKNVFKMIEALGTIEKICAKEAYCKNCPLYDIESSQCIFIKGFDDTPNDWKIKEKPMEVLRMLCH